jgi:hypothetical protein
MKTLDNLRKAAKRWLKALRANDAAAQARLRRTYPDAPSRPGLRDVQHALARERGFESWNVLRRVHSDPSVEQYANLAQDVLLAWEAGRPSAMQCLQDHYGRSFTPEEFRVGVQRRLEALSVVEKPRGEFALAHARLLVAHEAGFENWTALEQAFAAGAASKVSSAAVSSGVEPLNLTSRMIQPIEMRAALPVRLHDGVVTTTTKVWDMLTSCLDGDLEHATALVAECSGLVRCDYNYMTPLHLAVREGHVDLVQYLAHLGAANPNYVTYPYRETLITVALDRGYDAIAEILRERYRMGDPARPEDEGGEILYDIDDVQRRFQKLLNTDATGDVQKLLKERPDLAQNPFAFWCEGVLMMPAKRGARKMIELLMRHGARVPDVSKWGAWYYLWHYETAAFLLDHGMNPNHMNGHHTSVLHDMAYKGNTRKAALLLDHGADVNAIDEEFRSTALGLAVRWGHRETVRLLLERGADANAAGASWSTPLAWAEKKGQTDIEATLRRAGAGR